MAFAPPMSMVRVFWKASCLAALREFRLEALQCNLGIWEMQVFKLEIVGIEMCSEDRGLEYSTLGSTAIECP